MKYTYLYVLKESGIIHVYFFKTLAPPIAQIKVYIFIKEDKS